MAKREACNIKTIHCSEITHVVANLSQDACYYLGEDMLNAFTQAAEQEISQSGKDILKLLLDNAKIAKEEKIPICQDTGFTVVFIELGQEVYIEGGSLLEAVNEGVRKGYQEGYLRKSIVGDPLKRENTGDNTPCVIHTSIVPGDKLKITVAPKGGGSENMSALKMLKPADGLPGIKKFIIDTVKAAGPNPCPPLVVGVGIGGTMEKAAIMAKEALLRDVGTANPNKQLALLEKELLDDINKLGIGPQGLGGKVTALAVHIKTFAAHIASLPVAVNINCHASRHKSVTL